MEFWHSIYDQFDPVAFHIFSIPLHWYGIMYVFALLTALYVAKVIARRDNVGITSEQLDDYFIWVEIGVILGARLGYILFYDPNTSYYLTHPWQIFNPFQNGEFVGIRGMSFHGAVIGFVLGSYLFYKKHGIPFGLTMDVIALGIPFGYVFGRIGNFLNQELVGKATEVDWGIYVHGVLRHPSQLYEAFLEGVVVFILLYLYRTRKTFDGEIILMYGFLYGVTRFIAEFWRQPDVQIGYLYGDWFTQGQALSLLMGLVGIVLLAYFKRKKSV
jgi:phosphatidylglycerol---prolipoprotein diacylglyceryl transferase